jgi:ribosomal protein L11 methylase PrmA
MTNYSNSAVEEKERIIGQFLDQIQPESIWDLGANTGLYSRLASRRGVKTVAFDVDPGAVEQNYLASSTTKENCLLPLVMDLTNPSPALGWHHHERQSLLERGPVQVVMALALIHHLAISNNVPLDQLARFLSEACQWLIIEFVPKSDSQVIKLLATRKDIFSEYTVDSFEAVFGNFFTIITVQPISDSQRKIYLMKKIEQQQM